MPDLETLIRDWYWDEASDRFAREAGAFLLQFIHHFKPGMPADVTWVVMKERLATASYIDIPYKRRQYHVRENE